MLPPPSPLDVKNAFILANKEIYLHQLDLVSDLIMIDKPKVLLADDVGLGKTVQALAYLKLALDSGLFTRALLIVPASILDQWLEEMSNFNFPEDSFYVIENPYFPKNYQIYLITMDRAKKDEYLAEIEKVKWNLIMVDEAHRLRVGTLRAKIASIIESAEIRLLLTATPHTGDDRSFKFLKSLVTLTVRREKRDLEKYEGREVLPKLSYWIVRVSASREEAEALNKILQKLRQLNIEHIARYVALKRALSSPLSFLLTLQKLIKSAYDLRRNGNVEEEPVEEEPDGYLIRVREIASDFKSFTETDRKLKVLKSLLSEGLRNRKVLVFTEYATTAEYLFEKLSEEFNCSVIERGDGYAISESQNRSIMYVTSRARSRIDINQQVRDFAAKEGAILVSTDVFSEGVNLQMFDTVVNYEVTWSPTRHMQRIGRAWRFGQKSSEVLVVDLTLDIHLREGKFDKSEFNMYSDYLEKILDVSLHGLTPHNYADYVLYESSGSSLSKLFKLSGFEVDPIEVFESIHEERVDKIDEIKRKLERLIKLRSEVGEAKSVEDLRRDLKIKLGYPPRDPPETGGNYVMAEISFKVKGREVFYEKALVKISQSGTERKEVKIYRMLDCEGVDVADADRKISSNEENEVKSAIARDLTEPLKVYVKKLGYDAVARICSIKPVVIKGLQRFDSFEVVVESELKRARSRINTELEAVKHIKNYLIGQGYEIHEDYYSGPRPFDMVVRKDGKLYTVECKGRFIRDRDEPLSITLTANEEEWGLRYPQRHLVCIAVMSEENVNVEIYTFEEFINRWELRRKRNYYEYVIEAKKKA